MCCVVNKSVAPGGTRLKLLTCNQGSRDGRDARSAEQADPRPASADQGTVARRLQPARPRLIVRSEHCPCIRLAASRLRTPEISLRSCSIEAAASNAPFQRPPARQAPPELVRPTRIAQTELAAPNRYARFHRDRCRRAAQVRVQPNTAAMLTCERFRTIQRSDDPNDYLSAYTSYLTAVPTRSPTATACSRVSHE